MAAEAGINISEATEQILISTTFNSKCANTHDNNTRQGTEITGVHRSDYDEYNS